MATHNTPEERQLMKLITKMPVSEELKNTWTERIRADGMSEELAEEIREKLTAPVEEEVSAAARRTRYTTDLMRLVKQWRFSQQSRAFGKH